MARIVSSAHAMSSLRDGSRRVASNERTAQPKHHRSTLPQRRGEMKRVNSASSYTMPHWIDLKSITAEDVEWEGYLYKQRKIVKSWTPRYITLQNRTLTVYKSKTHAIAKQPHRGQWIIKKVKKTLASNGLGGTKLHGERLGFSCEATNGHVLHFIATCKIEKSLWMYMIHSSTLPSAPDRDTHIDIDALDLDSPRIPMKEEASDPLTRDARIAKHLADVFVTELVDLMTLGDDEPSIIAQLPSFLRQLSKDTELLFDLETAEASEPSCLFKGVYHGREGFVHFISRFASKYKLENVAEGTSLHSMDDEDHHRYSLEAALRNTASNSHTPGTLRLQLTLTPARRVSRLAFSFRQPSAGPTCLRKSVTTSPMCISEHAACFHQGFLSKRSLALSFTDFDVVGVLGKGGFGTVVLVKRHFNQDEFFAIKIIDKFSGADSALKERRILSGMKHPFLACLRFAFQTETKLYLGLDFYKGGNLYWHMHASKHDGGWASSRGKRLSLDQARFYAAELAIALTYLHDHGIIYRDLKPDNIMLDRKGHIRLVDFGISKQLSQDPSGENEYEPTGTLAGSPAYIAPEQLLTQKPQYGMAADWWSFGVLLYEFLTGTTPFADNNVSQMYKKIQTSDVKYDVTPPMDPDASDLLQKLLVRDPSQRVAFPQMREHPFFKCIDWVKLEKKEVTAPFIPKAEELMQNVHEHFRNMKVEKSMGNIQAPGEERNAKKVSSRDCCSHFDEFSFCYDKMRETFDGLNMVDDGWLVRQLQEGAALRDRLQSSSGEVESCPVLEIEELTDAVDSSSPVGGNYCGNDHEATLSDD